MMNAYKSSYTYPVSMTFDWVTVSFRRISYVWN